MAIDKNLDVGSLEGQTYIIGREGQIYINDKSVSKRHAELKFIDGRVRLRDLNSTNGTYLIKDNKLVSFQEGYVTLHQPIAIGTRQYTIQGLLAFVGVFAAYSDEAGLKIRLAKPN